MSFGSHFFHFSSASLAFRRTVPSPNAGNSPPPSQHSVQGSILHRGSNLRVTSSNGSCDIHLILTSILLILFDVLLLLPSSSLAIRPAESDRFELVNATESSNISKSNSFADMIDRALENEFPENDEIEVYRSDL
ncbi:unnamed protein product [Lupinus luteus]|uniref:Uncharacterized protein n=1 Tax=Lupinus luteus TaxID=3873 RepID=A0AAV1YFJ9_LUPLU